MEEWPLMSCNSLDKSSFTVSTGNMANGGFNKLCD